jgi:signal transduction histidine kinase
MSIMRVLIVDASREERQLIVATLCDLTNVVVVGAVARLHSALYALADTTPDVIVTDSELADDHGADLIAAVQRSANPPIVVVYGSDDQRDRCIDAGAEHYVSRASGVDELARMISCVGVRRRRPTATDRFAQIGRIAASATHDLRNYLGVAALSLSRVDRTPIPADDPVRDSLANLHRALDCASRITGSMLAYADGRVPEMQSVSIAAVVRNTLEMFQRTLPTEINTVVELDPVPPIRGIESELEQMVLNLIFNAVDAMPQGGNVVISVRADRANVVLVVRDTGRGTEGTAQARGSSALGLGLSRDVATRHDAKLRITTIPNSGTQVVVEFAAVS